MDDSTHMGSASREDADVRDSVLLIAAAVGLAAGVYLIRYETLFYELQMTILGSAIAAASTLAVFVRRSWVGVLVVALAFVATFLLLVADFFTMRALVAPIIAAVAGMAMLAAMRAGDSRRD